MAQEKIKMELSRKEFNILFSALGWLKEHNNDLLAGRGYMGKKVKITQEQKNRLQNENVAIGELQAFFAGI